MRAAGAPTVYYGDEIGMTGMADPWNRAPMRWDDPDDTLREDVSRLLWQRRGQAVLQTGYLSVEAADADTLKIRRFTIEGKDAFGVALNERDTAVRVTRKL